jgi:hypothetical protein
MIGLSLTGCSTSVSTKGSISSTLSTISLKNTIVVPIYIGTFGNKFNIENVQKIMNDIMTKSGSITHFQFIVTTRSKDDFDRGWHYNWDSSYLASSDYLHYKFIGIGYWVMEGGIRDFYNWFYRKPIYFENYVKLSGEIGLGLALNSNASALTFFNFGMLTEPARR